ncbi:hypothetical protein [Streptomyces sp. NBC_01423]|uniref:hypothetical protein n=1 Tax=Streptomyces sp. NBC_01423 TaxID=2903860 RepID=UPI002E2B25B3|nr:hypothetical protein [Streptomyces sp. NBC_01423]
MRLADLTLPRWRSFDHRTARLPLATANRSPAMVEFVYGPDGEDMYEDSPSGRCSRSDARAGNLSWVPTVL